MSFSIPQSYVEQFSSFVQMLSEQRMSRLRRTVRMDTVVGESAAIERMGGIDKPNQVTELHGDTPLNSTPHSRRWLFIASYDVADLIDNTSQVRLLIDPQGRYVMRHAGTMGRGIDDTLIEALGGTAIEGKNKGTPVALPAAQKIASGTTGMTIQKLNEAKERLDAAEVDEFWERYIVLTSRQLRELLEDDKVTSNDFNTVKALVRGELDEFLGFTFVRSERLLKPAADRLCYAYAQPGVTLGIAAEPQSAVDPRPDKRRSMQVYTWGSWGAVRVEDEMVVEIACTEA